MSQRQYIVVDEGAPFLPISSRTSGLATGYAIEAAEEDHLDELEELEEMYEPRLDDEAVMRRMDDTLQTDKPLE